MAVRRPSPFTLASGVALGVAGVRPRTIVARGLPQRVRTSTRPSLLALPKHHAHRVVPARSQTTTIPSRRVRSVNAVPPEALATVVDPFGVSPEQWELIEGNLFGASLLPYLAFLYFLQMPECRMPPRALFGFKFLLVFVFGTIPCAIYAKLQYDDILANVDWLHGPAESLLTITNLLIVVGMREGLRAAREENGGDGGSGDHLGGRKPIDGSSVGGAILGWGAGATATTLALAAAANGVGPADAADAAPALAELSSLFRHAEPANALSLPTWIIHVSSLIEWLVAMGLIWEYADVTGIRAYKGLTWGMVPSHASGIAACTFHLFYNAPQLSAIVASQAGLTVIGNATCAAAAYRIAKQTGADVRMPWAKNEGEATGGEEEGEAREEAAAVSPAAAVGGADELGVESALVGWENLGQAWSADSDAALVVKLAVVSAALSAVVKWGSLAVDFPFEPNVWLAFAVVFGPTALNATKWGQISKEEEAADR